MTRTKVMTAWTLKDLLAAHYSLVYGTSPTFLSFAADFSSSVTFPASTSRIEELWQAIVIRYRKEIALITSSESTDPIGTDNPEVTDFAAGLCSILRQTIPRYTVLLDLYDAKKANLLAKVETITGGTVTSASNNSASSDSLTKRNDTPQAAGDWTTDPYTSEASKGTASSSSSASGTVTENRTSSSDLTSVMARLQEVQQGYRSLLKDWTGEFSGLFAEAENQEYVED